MKSINKNLALHWQVIIGLVLGGVYAWFAVANNWIHFTMDYINPFGNIFINLLKGQQKSEEYAAINPNRVICNKLKFKGCSCLGC